MWQEICCEQLTLFTQWVEEWFCTYNDYKNNKLIRSKQSEKKETYDSDNNILTIIS